MNDRSPRVRRETSLALPTGAMGRRRFLALAGGLAAGVAGCSQNRHSFGEAVRQSAAPLTDTGPSSTTAASTGSVSATDIAGLDIADDRVLVVVTLDGGNDAINTLPPVTGRYHDLRPSLAIDPADSLQTPSLSGHALHPAMAPLIPRFEAGTMAIVAGVGFPAPDRSHFVSTDRWDRADLMDEQLGWLGRWLDSIAADQGGALPALGATALGSTGRSMLGAERSGVSIGEVDAFAFPELIDHADIRRIADGGEHAGGPLAAAARSALLSSVGAVEEFDVIADAVRDSDRGPRSGPFANGLAVAAELIRSQPGTRIVSVAANGFDTHGQQLGQHAGLLADLATGLDEFWTAMEASGNADRVVLITTSEFGRRVAENGSAGTDHGSAGLSIVMGEHVVGGLHGAIELDDVVDGDLRPIFDPRTIYTACLDWLGGDAERVLGARWDETTLLRA